MLAKIFLWLGALLMLIGVINSYFSGPHCVGIVFPIGATMVFFATRSIESA